MTEDDFIDMHCAKEGLPRQDLAKRRVAVPCDCGHPNCPGWMMIPGPDMLAGPRFLLPSGLSPEQIMQFMDDCASGKIKPSRD